jgi:hypothetical protein
MISGERTVECLVIQQFETARRRFFFSYTTRLASNAYHSKSAEIFVVIQTLGIVQT